MYSLEQLQQKNIKQLKEIGWQLNVFPEADRRCRQNWIDALVGVNPPLLQLLEVFPAAFVVEQVQPIIETVETPSAVEVEPFQMLPIESNFGRIIYLQPAQELIAPAAQKFPRVERVTEFNRNNFSGFERVTESNRNNFSGFERVQELIENFPGVEVDSVSEAIAQAAETSPGVESDRHPILRGVTFSDRFLACYSPPQAQIIHFQSDADGQLSLLNFEIESASEPPDPDDFESLDAFREAIARWDFEHNEVSPEHNEVNPEYNEPLQVSLDSFSLWGLCPADWYESALLEPSSMLELSQTCKSSITSDFFILTFDCLSDRPNRSDEPPDTVTFAKLPKPKPPSFPPATVGQAQPKPQPTAIQPQAKRIPNAYQTHTCCIVAGSSTQPARSPPGGDAGF
jgi:hypothetical protein